MRRAVVLFTRDLRVRDHAALAAAAREAEEVVPLFVIDERIVREFARPNRAAFLAEALRDLDRALRARGARLVVRRGDVARETTAVADAIDADAVLMSADVSAYAHDRHRRLDRACRERRRALRTYPGITVVPAGDLEPGGGDHYRVFTPYWRVWSRHLGGAGHNAPHALRMPAGVRGDDLPDADDLAAGPRSPELPEGGEEAGRRRLRNWMARGLERYGERHDDLPGDATSRLSPYLHLGCLSAGQVVRAAQGRPGGEELVRQLCWRDFHHQVLNAFPTLPREDYRGRGRTPIRDDGRLERWREGRTGIPVVDAGMRQLAREGWMHNRARLIVASYLTRDLGLDWRAGAAHFLDLLVDGDLANNSGNWQWVAGTGNDTRPNRRFNPLRQAARFDRQGDYVRRYVPELARIAGAAVHRPWRLPREQRRLFDYPEPLTEHA